MRVIATAGHVDHGKSSLVLALTGTDPDRLEEEHRRGLTIDLGFAHTTVADDVGAEDIAFVDVPGHVRFLRNMLAGVGGVDACLFVVAATEGWKPQSEEHLRILELVGVHHGVIALTKIDVLDDADLVELAVLEVAERVAGTFLAGAPIVPVAAPSGIGLDRLGAELAGLARRTPASPDRGRPRLWIDRVFAARGSGTVVTGTLTDGAVEVDQHVVVEPAGQRARVRAIQTLGVPVDRIGPGNRVALNLAGVDRHELTRGDVVVTLGRWRATRVSMRRSRCCARSTTRCRAAVPTSPTSARASTPCGCACSARPSWRRHDRCRSTAPRRRAASAARRPVRAPGDAAATRPSAAVRCSTSPRC